MKYAITTVFVLFLALTISHGRQVERVRELEKERERLLDVASWTLAELWVRCPETKPFNVNFRPRVKVQTEEAS